VRYVTISRDGDLYELTIHNPGVDPRTVHRTRAGAILTLHYWGVKDATKTVNAATEEPARVQL